MFKIYVKPRKQLLSRWYKHFLAKRIKALNLSALETADWLAARIYREDIAIYDEFDAEIPIYADSIEEAYHYDDEMGWNDDIKEYAERYPERRPRDSELLKYQLWDAAWQIEGKPITFENG